MGFFSNMKEKWDDFKDEMERDYDTKNGTEAVGAVIGAVTGVAASAYADLAEAAYHGVKGDTGKAKKALNSNKRTGKYSDAGAKVGKNLAGPVKQIGGIIVGQEIGKKYSDYKAKHNNKS